DGLPDFLCCFPYVNGGLFGREYPVPHFSRQARRIIMECGALNWKDINPDIFGSMIQAVVHSEQRGSLGMHYTSVTNIMKVIGPLFLDDLREAFAKAGKTKEKLKGLLARLRRIRIFDPACGSGNFLIIAYKELCRLEIDILKKLQGPQKSFKFMSNIKLTQFYGIELDDFAHETAKLSLWLAEHQMNMAFREVFGEAKPTLPLQDGGNIVCGNATRLDWEGVCPNDEGGEVYVLGNPPYLGGKFQSKEQKQDMKFSFHGQKKIGELDYISCWFIKSAEYISTTHYSCAFVTTSSICQGSQVHQLWPLVFNKNIEITFAHKPFKWSNNAKSNAQIICSIIGISGRDKKVKYIFDSGVAKKVKYISAYLTQGSNCIVRQSLRSISNFPKILTGNSPYDGGNLLLSTEQKKILFVISQGLVN
ncbi:MAG: class I SAM-dependent DNA methyltransferase, partial [Candidatus Electrothrix sp. AR3]|nr:class I SAM-dependent DNA methyltransferase [Candidatus Electrothrix sp. AR3]